MTQVDSRAYSYNSAFKYGGDLVGGMLVTFTDAGLYVSRDAGVSFKLVNSRYGQFQVDSNGLIVMQASGKLFKTTDFGETWEESPTSTTSLDDATACFDSDGNWLVASRTNTNVYYSARQYNYDVATQFKTPAHIAPKGYKAYIKGKLQ